MEFVYKVTLEGEVYFIEDIYDVVRNFGTVEEVVRYRLTDPEDVTDEANQHN